MTCSYCGGEHSLSKCPWRTVTNSAFKLRQRRQDRRLLFKRQRVRWMPRNARMLERRR